MFVYNSLQLNFCDSLAFSENLDVSELMLLRVAVWLCFSNSERERICHDHVSPYPRLFSQCFCVNVVIEEPNCEYYIFSHRTENAVAVFFVDLEWCFVDVCVLQRDWH